MKAAGALLALASIATVIAVIVAVSGTKDDLVGDMRSCVKRGEATIVHGPANLGPARREIIARTITKQRTLHKDGDTVILLHGRAFRLLVLANGDSPPLSGDLPKRIYERADEYPVVAIEVAPSQDVLAGCASLAAR